MLVEPVRVEPVLVEPVLVEPVAGGTVLGETVLGETVLGKTVIEVAVDVVAGVSSGDEAQPVARRHPMAAAASDRVGVLTRCRSGGATSARSGPRCRAPSCEPWRSHDRAAPRG